MKFNFILIIMGTFIGLVVYLSMIAAVDLTAVPDKWSSIIGTFLNIGGLLIAIIPVYLWDKQREDSK